MIVFRLSKDLYKNDLSGKGAEMAGGRWNSKGIPILYTAENRALCTAELAVHLPLGIMPKNYFLIQIEIPKNTAMLKIPLNKLPKDWNTFPHPVSTKEIGDRFVKQNKCLVMKAPSAIIHGEYNYLINPGHKHFRKVKILNVESYEFDRRLFFR